MELATLRESAAPGCRQRGDVGVGITVEQLTEHVAKLFGLVVGHIGQRVEKHELGHQRRQRVVAFHAAVYLVYLAVAVGEIVVIGPAVERLLLGLHVAQFLYIGGVFHGPAVFRVGKLREYTLPERLGQVFAPRAHVHEIAVVIYVEAIHVVGIACHELVPFGLCGGEVLHAVLEYEPRVVEPFLYHFVGRSLLHVGGGYLPEIVFWKMRVGGARRGAGSRDAVGRFVGGLRVVACVGCVILFAGLVDGCKRSLVASAPVVLEFARAPPALEFGASGVACGGVVEIP